MSWSGVQIPPCLLEIYSPNHSPIAQLAEYLTVNQSVPGSSPGGGVALVAQLVEHGFCKAVVASSSLVGGLT